MANAATTLKKQAKQQSRRREANPSAQNVRFEILKPPKNLRDVVKIRKFGPGVSDPIAKAENELMLLEDEFPRWLREETAKLKEAWDRLQRTPTSPKAFRQFHKAIHSIRGHGAILGCEAATNLAGPIAKLLERNPSIEPHLELIQLGTNSIYLAVTQQLTANDPRIKSAVHNMLTIVDRWLARKVAD